MDVLDDDDQPLSNPPLKIGWTWEGRRDEEHTDPVALDKGPLDASAGNVVIYKGMIMALWLQGGDRMVSDVVSGLQTAMPDADPATGNSRFHNSFYIVFRKRETVVQPPPPQPVTLETLAADVAAWAKGFADRDDLSDYLYNLLVVARLGVVEQRTAGLAASMIVSYTKERERELQRQRQAATSHHVGTVGKRETFKGLLCEGIIYLDGQFPSHLHKFRDGEGNVVVWFSSSLTLKQGQVYDLTATVKDHNTRDGVAQTIITRAKVVATAQAA
jgi:hypothetical protein